MSVFVKRRRPWYYYCIPVGLFLKPSTLWWQDPCSWISSSTVHVSLPIVSYPPVLRCLHIPRSMALSSFKPKRGGGRSRSLWYLGFIASWKYLWMFCLRFWILVGARWEDENGNNKLKSKHGPVLLTPVLFMLSLSRNAKMHLLSQRKDKILPPEQQNSVNKCWITSFFVYLLLLLIMVCHRPPTPMLLCLSLVVFVHGFSQDQLLCFDYLLLFCSWFLTEPTPMLLCLSLVVFVHGFSQDQLLCFFVYFLLLLFMVSHGTNSYASLFISCCFCSWFFSQKQVLCFFVYLLLCLFMVPYRTNSYASLFILYFVHGVSLLGTDHTNCAWQWIDRYIHFTRSIAFLSYSKKEWWVPEDHQPLPPTLSTGHHKLLFSLWDCRGKPPRAFSKQELRALGWGGRLASYPNWDI